MRILITNDDGINAPGLQVAQAIAQDIAGPSGEIWTVAPAFEQSGVGHCISYTHPFQVSRFDTRRFAVEGSPADCVLTALHEIMDTPPDLVLSGVNRGNNSAENALYSGTLGAAMEAALQGLPAIALSQYMGPATRDLDNIFEASAQHGAEVVRKLIDKGPWQKDANYRLFYNVNFPPVAGKDVAGVRAAHQGWRHDASFSAKRQPSPSGRDFIWLQGGPQATPSDPGMDVTENLDGYISVTPMRADLTAYDQLDQVRELFK